MNDSPGRDAIQEEQLVYGQAQGVANPSRQILQRPGGVGFQSPIEISMEPDRSQNQVRDQSPISALQRGSPQTLLENPLHRCASFGVAEDLHGKASRV
jgi:hypothetical protein